MKNCGTLIHDEIATKQYMEQMKELVKNSQHENVKQKTLELIQAWAHAFRNSPKYRAVQVICSCLLKCKDYLPQLILFIFIYTFMFYFHYIILFPGYIEYYES